MKITICGSIAFINEMNQLKNQLENTRHEVKMPPNEIQNDNGILIPVSEYYLKRKSETSDTSWIWQRKAEAMKTHFEKIAWSDAVLVLNYDKNNIKSYIGGNTLIEMGVAFYLNKKIFLLNNIPEISYKEEILGMQPIVINGNFNKIK